MKNKKILDSGFSVYFKTLKHKIEPKKLIKLVKLDEAESVSKGGPLISKKTRAFYHWSYQIKPAIFDIDFKYNVVFDLNKIKLDYTDPDNPKKADFNSFYTEHIQPMFSERGIWIKGKSIAVDNFKVDYITYLSDTTDKALNPNRKNKYTFSHTFTIEALDNKDYNKKDIQKIAQEFVNKIENQLYQDTEYYKITK